MKFYKQLLLLLLVLASFTTNAQRLNQLQRGTEENQILVTKGGKFIPAYLSLEETEQLLQLDNVKEDIQVLEQENQNRLDETNELYDISLGNSTKITALENTAVKSVNGILPINGNVSIMLTDYSGDIATLQSELEERASEINELFNELNTTNNAVTTIDESAVKSVNGVLPVNGNVSIVLTDYSGDISTLQSQLNTIKEDIQVNSTKISTLENTAVKSVNGVLPINGNVSIQLTDYTGDLADLQSQINALDLSTITNSNSISELENTAVKSVNGVLPVNGNVSIQLTDYSGDLNDLQEQINGIDLSGISANATAINDIVNNKLVFKKDEQGNIYMANFSNPAINGAKNNIKIGSIATSFDGGSRNLAAGGQSLFFNGSYSVGLSGFNNSLKNHYTATVSGRDNTASNIGTVIVGGYNLSDEGTSSPWSVFLGGRNIQLTKNLLETAIAPSLAIFNTPVETEFTSNHHFLVRNSAYDGRIEKINPPVLEINGIKPDSLGRLSLDTSDTTEITDAISANTTAIAANTTWIDTYTPYNDAQLRQDISENYLKKENGNVKLSNNDFFSVKNIENGITNTFLAVSSDKIAMWVRPDNYNPDNPDDGRSRFTFNKDKIEFNADNLPYSNSIYTIDLGSRYGLFSKTKDNYQTIEENDSNLKSFRIYSPFQSSFMAQTSEKFSFWAQNGNDVNTRSLFRLDTNGVDIQAKALKLATNNNSKAIEVSESAIVARFRKTDGTYSSISLKENGCTISGGWYFHDTETLQDRDLIALIKSLEARIAELENNHQ